VLLTLGTIFRDGLRSDVQKWSEHETASAKTSIEDRRKKLEERLNHFNQKAQEMIGDNVEEVLDILPPFTGWKEDHEGVYEDEDEESDVCEDEESDVCEDEESNGMKMKHLTGKKMKMRNLRSRRRHRFGCHPH
jgi:hypothetical protein